MNIAGGKRIEDMTPALYAQMWQSVLYSRKGRPTGWSLALRAVSHRVPVRYPRDKSHYKLGNF